jgi:hypothetical protein
MSGLNAHFLFAAIFAVGATRKNGLKPGRGNQFRSLE